MDDELLTLARMARRLGVTMAWLRNMADAELVPCLKAGTRYLFNPQVVEARLAELAARPPKSEGGEQ